jgi:DNA mismatch repair ATPase MutS
VALCALGEQRPSQVHNQHFTDVMVDGEMRFDYRLREGIVRTSNALRLLAMAGIDVPAAERAAVEPGPAQDSEPSATERA